MCINVILFDYTLKEKWLHHIKSNWARKTRGNFTILPDLKDPAISVALSLYLYPVKYTDAHYYCTFFFFCFLNCRLLMSFSSRLKIHKSHSKPYENPVFLVLVRVSDCWVTFIKPYPSHTHPEFSLTGNDVWNDSIIPEAARSAAALL